MTKILILSLFLYSCSDTKSPSSPSQNNSNNSEDILSSYYDLQSCKTDIAEDVPIFFHKYFHCVTAKLSKSGNYINLYYNGLPPYSSWYYSPNSPNYVEYQSQGNGYYKNPNIISENNYVISIPVTPTKISNHQIGENAVDGKIGTDSYEYPMGSVGAALNGANLYNPLARPGDVIEDEIFSFDLYSGHPVNGEYHYHTSSQGPLEVLKHKMPAQISNILPGSSEIELYGIMCDGTVVMGCTELDKSKPNISQLDCQNGHSHDILDEDGTLLLQDRYHTHICYSSLNEKDFSGNGCEDHEFTPEVSYYTSSGTGSNNVCSKMIVPIEPDSE